MRLHQYATPVAWSILHSLKNNGPQKLLTLFDSIPNRGSCDVPRLRRLFLRPMLEEGLISLNLADNLYSILPDGLAKLEEKMSPPVATEQEPPSGDFLVAARRSFSVPAGSLLRSSLGPSCSRPSGEDFLRLPSVVSGTPHPRVRPAQIPSKMSGFERNC